MATFAPVLLDGLLTRNPALETFPVRAGGVTVIEEAVGDEILVDRAEVEALLGRPTGSRDPAGGIHDQRWHRR